MIIPIKIMNKTIIKHNNFIECFLKNKNKKIQGPIPKCRD